MAALLAASVAYQLNASMLSPALQTMARELHTSESAAMGAQTVFFTVAALFSLFLPRFSDIAGRRKTLCWILGVLIAGSVICALAPNIEVLILGRAIEGVSGPMIQIALLMLRAKIHDEKQYGLLLGIVAAVNGGIAGVDALAGGYIAAHFGFRPIFWVVVVISAIALALVLRYTSETRPSANTKMDWIGVVPLVISVMSLLLALGEAARIDQRNWSLILAWALVCAIGFVSFYLVESRRREPLVSIAHLRQRATWSLLLTTTLTLTGCYAAVYGSINSFAQNTAFGFALTADKTSLILLTPFAIAGWIVGPFAGRMAPTLGFCRVMRVGLVGSIVCLVLLGTFGLHSLPMLVIGTTLLGVAYAGITNIILNALGIALSPGSNPGFLPGLNAGAFNLGAGLGFAILSSIQFAGTTAGNAPSGYSRAILSGAAITTVALLTSFLIPEPRPAGAARESA